MSDSFYANLGKRIIEVYKDCKAEEIKIGKIQQNLTNIPDYSDPIKEIQMFANKCNKNAQRMKIVFDMFKGELEEETRLTSIADSIERDVDTMIDANKSSTNDQIIAKKKEKTIIFNGKNRFKEAPPPPAEEEAPLPYIETVAIENNTEKDPQTQEIIISSDSSQSHSSIETLSTQIGEKYFEKIKINAETADSPHYLDIDIIETLDYSILSNLDQQQDDNELIETEQIEASDQTDSIDNGENGCEDSPTDKHEAVKLIEDQQDLFEILNEKAYMNQELEAESNEAETVYPQHTVSTPPPKDFGSSDLEDDFHPSQIFGQKSKAFIASETKFGDGLESIVANMNKNPFET